MNKLILFLLPLLFLGGCTLSKEKLPQIVLKDKGLNFDFIVDQQFQVVLPSNQTTGYQWQVDDITLGVLELVDNEYQVSDKYTTNVVGAGGEEIWTFKVKKIARSHVVMKYRRPWDQKDVANNFLITINGNPGDDGLITYIGSIKAVLVGEQGDDYFKTDTGEEFGVEPFAQDKIFDPGIKSVLMEVKDQDVKVEIRGKFSPETTDYNNKRFIIYEINRQ